MVRYAATVIFSAILLVGCATPDNVPEGVPKASLMFESFSDSTGTTGRHLNVLPTGPGCSPWPHGRILIKKMSAAETDVFGPAYVPASAPVALTINYFESRMGQQRSCAAMASFTPEEGRRYRIAFKTVRQVQACEIEIYDEARNKIAFDTPSVTCAGGLNGVGGIIDWKVKVQRQ